ncbi:MAG: hypothetical protein U0792_11390 [Gemmataceae bacterium]
MTDELRTLCSAAVDTPTPERGRRLEELVLADPAARRFVRSISICMRAQVGRRRSRDAGKRRA